MIKPYLDLLCSKFPETAVSFTSIVISDSDIVQAEVVELLGFKAQKKQTLGEQIDELMMKQPARRSISSRLSENKGEPSEFLLFGKIEFRTLKVSGMTGEIEFIHELKSGMYFRVVAYAKFRIGNVSVPLLAYDWCNGVELCALFISDFMKDPNALYEKNFQ